jgi:chromosome segregation ATPase
MIKKVIILGGVVLAALVLLGTSAKSYFRTFAGGISESVQNSVPVEFQLQRARTMIKDLTPEVRKNMHTIAKEEVELARLDEQIGGAETSLDKEKEQVLRLKADLGSGKTSLQYGDRSYTVEEVKTDLAHRFDRYKTNEATLASLKQIRQARQKSVAAARQKLDGMLAAKRQLQVEVENLEARMQMVAAAQTTSNYQFDESQLGQVKELVSNLKTRLEVAEKLVNAESTFQDEIPVDKPASGNIVQQVSEYFPDQKPDVKAVAKK